MAARRGTGGTVFRRAKGWRERPTARWGVSRAAATAAGYRSSYEYAIALQLEREGIPFEYEVESYKVDVDAGRKYSCSHCGNDDGVVRTIEYTPDFFLLDRNVVIEAKGRFDAAHRVKAVAFKEQYPDCHYLLLFEADNKISPKSKTRYSDWATKKEIPWSIGLIPRHWLQVLTAPEPPLKF